MLIPSFDNVLLLPLGNEDKTINGIVIPGTNKGGLPHARVIAYGPGIHADGTDLTFPFGEGDEVIYTGNGVEVTDENERYVHTKFLDVLYKVA